MLARTALQRRSRLLVDRRAKLLNTTITAALAAAFAEPATAQARAEPCGAVVRRVQHPHAGDLYHTRMHRQDYHQRSMRSSARPGHAVGVGRADRTDGRARRRRLRTRGSESLDLSSTRRWQLHVEGFLLTRNHLFGATQVLHRRLVLFSAAASEPSAAAESSSAKPATAKSTAAESASAESVSSYSPAA